MESSTADSISYILGSRDSNNEFAVGDEGANGLRVGSTYLLTCYASRMVLDVEDERFILVHGGIRGWGLE